MLRSKQFKTLFPFILLAVVLILSYHFFLKDYYWNNKDQTIEINQKSVGKVIHLKKYKAQKVIQSLEMEASGTTDQLIIFRYGDSPKTMVNEFYIKPGKIDFVNVVEWRENDCYVQVVSGGNSKTNLTLTYRFIAKNY